VTYSLDTSALMQPWNDTYPREVFGTFWDRYHDLVVSGDAVAIDEVLTEIEKRDDDLCKWVKSHPGMFVPAEKDIQLALIKVLAHSERMVGSQKGRNAADPWVVALALARGFTVVTMELSSGNPTKPKIPDVCAALGVRCISVIGLAQEQRWTF